MLFYAHERISPADRIFKTAKIMALAIGCLAWILTISGVAFGQEPVGVFFERYIRTNSAPNVFQNSFTATPGDGFLVIENGSDNIHPTMVSSAEIWINDEKVLGPSDLNKNISRLERRVHLVEMNSIKVVLNSKPGSFLFVKIYSYGNGPIIIPVEEPTYTEGPYAYLQAQGNPIIILNCKPPESGSPLPFPTTAITLKGSFYVYAGAADWLPPDPGELGKQTVLGIDSDGDYVRDDIELFIARLLPGGEQVKLRKYLFEYAQWRGQFLKSGLSTEYAKEISRNLYRSAECVRRLTNDDSQSRYYIDKVFSLFHNTFPRSYRYIDNNKKLGGWITREKTSVTCP